MGKCLQLRTTVPDGQHEKLHFLILTRAELTEMVNLFLNDLFSYYIC